MVENNTSEVRTEPKTKGYALMADISEHGEIHMTVDQHDNVEVEARKGQTKYNSTIDTLLIDDGTTIHRISVDNVVSWYKPMDVFHGEN